mgnify:CR=1 FL=1
MTVSRQIAWRDLCLKADPDFARTARTVVEYEFSTTRTLGDERLYRNGRRIFEGDYQRRGAYRPQEATNGGLTWNGQNIFWDGQEVIWDPE